MATTPLTAMRAPVKERQKPILQRERHDGGLEIIDEVLTLADARCV